MRGKKFIVNKALANHRRVSLNERSQQKGETGREWFTPSRVDREVCATARFARQLVEATCPW